MNRIYKFRAWGKEHKEMWTHDQMLESKFSLYDISQSSAYEVMQFTGLKDKNGKEIYEGDIVTSDYQRTLDEVIFSSGCFCLKNAKMEYEATYWGAEIEIKGNIYENPDLLKQLSPY